MGELDGKVALVTGAGRGIGAEVARKLAALGAQVCVSDVDAEVAQAVADEVGGAAHVGNLLEAGQPDALVATAVEAFGKLDIVVNNAGFAVDAPLHKLTDEAIDQMLGIHTVVPLKVLRAASPYLREPAKADAAAGNEVFRKVVNVSSLAGVMGNAGQTAYAAGKAGVIGLTRSLAKEWGPLKINVNAVAFGYIQTRMTAGLPDKVISAFESAVPLGRGAAPSEAADGIVFLCSPASNYVHGQVLNVSGGVQMGMAS